jgi:Spy/CpxP family protein refolding chaperone
MKISKPLMSLLLAAGAFAALPSIHAQTNTSTNNPAPPRQRPGRQVAESRTAYLSQALNLTAEQKPKVQAILEEEFKAVQETPREERRQKAEALREETNKKLKGILTEEQYTKYQAMGARGQGRRPPGSVPPDAPKPEEKKPEAAP